MEGQLTYNKNNKAWNHTLPNQLTSKICREPYKIQSRDGKKDYHTDDSYYIAWTGGNRNYGSGDVELQNLMNWIESILGG